MFYFVFIFLNLNFGIFVIIIIMKTEFEVTLQKDIRVRLGGIVSKRIWRVWPVL